MDETTLPAQGDDEPASLYGARLLRIVLEHGLIDGRATIRQRELVLAASQEFVCRVQDATGTNAAVLARLHGLRRYLLAGLAALRAERLNGEHVQYVQYVPPHKPNLGPMAKLGPVHPTRPPAGNVAEIAF